MRRSRHTALGLFVQNLGRLGAVRVKKRTWGVRLNVSHQCTLAVLETDCFYCQVVASRTQSCSQFPCGTHRFTPVPSFGLLTAAKAGPPK